MRQNINSSLLFNFEEMSDRFFATIPVPGKGTAPEVTPEVTPEVISRLQKYRLTRLGRDIIDKKDRKS